MGKLIIEMDSTQLAAFSTCERIWNYAYRQGLQPVTAKDGVSDPIMMGTYMHTMAEIYYRERVHGMLVNNALELALNVDMDSRFCACNHEPAQHAADGGKCEQVDCKCEKLIYAPFPLEKPKMSEVRERFSLYAYTYSNHDFTIEREDQLELGFAELLEETDEHLFILTGRIDVAYPKIGGDTFGFIDHKLQTNKHALHKKRLQFRNYGMVTGAKMAMINYFRMAKNVDKQTFERVIIPYEIGEHVWWRGELIKLFNRVKQARITGTYMPNWDTCEGRWGVCQFDPICSAPRRELITIEAFYRARPEWRPW